jgi:hypothetical protein
MPGKKGYNGEEVSSVLPTGKMPAGVKGKKRQAMKATYRKINTNNAGTTVENRESGDENFNK